MEQVRFYADEQFPKAVSEHLRVLGHDVLTVQEAGNANQKIPDDAVLEFATQNDRAVLTFNHSDFVRLHRENAEHAGIISCTQDRNHIQLALRIHQAVVTVDSMQGQFLRIVRSAKAN